MLSLVGETIWGDGRETSLLAPISSFIQPLQTSALSVFCCFCILVGLLNFPVPLHTRNLTVRIYDHDYGVLEIKMGPETKIKNRSLM